MKKQNVFFITVILGCLIVLATLSSLVLNVSYQDFHHILLLLGACTCILCLVLPKKHIAFNLRKYINFEPLKVKSMAKALERELTHPLKGLFLLLIAIFYHKKPKTSL